MIWICIPVHNNIMYTSGCIDSLLNQTVKDFKIIICDDGSSDNTEEIIMTKYPEVILLKGDGNLWWAGAINKCFDHALKNGQDDDYILTLNNDLIVKQDYIEKLLLNVKQSEVIGSLVVDINNENSIVFAGELMNRFSAKSFMIHRNYKGYEKRNEWETDFLTGRGTMFPIRLLKEIGFMHNTTMPQYGADVEFSVRAKKIGYRLKMHKDVKVFSYVENTGKGSIYNKNSFKEFLLSFFTLRSPNYYKSRFYFAKEYTCSFWLPFFLLFQFFRISGGYIKRSIQLK